MKNSIKRAQSQARLSFAERENFRPKVKQLKKTLLTIVALLAVTGAWADGTVTVTEIKASDIQTWANDGTVVSTADLPGFNTATEDAAKAWTGVPSSGTTLLLYEYDTNQSTWKYIYFEDGGSGTAYTYTFTRDDIMGHLFDGHKVYYTGSAASSAFEVAWDKDKKTGKFTMPAGNVTLEPDYYPQATAAEGAVTAADADARATTDDPLVKVDATKLTGAKKLMYFVSNSGTTAPAYDAEGWTDQLPTAEGFTQQGIVYVWYYPVGTDEGVDEATATYSDGDICATALTVSLGAAPTYAVTFADDLTEPDKWTASPATGVKKGTEVTVNYTGSKKVIGVKAEKKAAAPVPITVTWYNDDITGTWGKSFTKDGVTITAGFIDFDDKNFMEGGTFSTTLGNFTKIEVTTGVWNASGTGWSGSGQSGTWTGNASSVSFSGDIMGMAMGNTKFVFTIEPTN